MPSAEAVARYFLHLAAATEEPTPVTQMQLHKLLYYAQGWCLATRERPLFPARFQAWTHGPVEADLYPTFADYGSQPIAAGEAREDPLLSREDRGFLESIWLCYGKYAAWRLREMTHNEAPWKDARRTVPRDAVSRVPMTEETMRSFFRGMHEANCRKMGMTAADLAQARRDVREGRGIPWEELVAEFASDAHAPSAAAPGAHAPVARRDERSRRAG